MGLDFVSSQLDKDIFPDAKINLGLIPLAGNYFSPLRILFITFRRMLQRILNKSHQKTTSVFLILLCIPLHKRIKCFLNAYCVNA